MCAKWYGWLKKPKEWTPLSDVWLSMTTAVVTALLVNTVSGFRITLLSFPQFFLLVYASWLIGIYWKEKAKALNQIDAKINRNKYYGPEHASDREKEREDAYKKLWMNVQNVFYGSIVCIVLAVSLIFVQACLDKKSVDDQTLFYKQSTTDQAEFRQSLAKDVEQISAKFNELKTQYAELVVAIQNSAQTTQQAGEVNSGGAVPQNNIEPVDSNSTEEKQPDK